jgi:hypothetical protein
MAVRIKKEFSSDLDKAFFLKTDYKYAPNALGINRISALAPVFFGKYDTYGVNQKSRAVFHERYPMGVVV